MKKLFVTGGSGLLGSNVAKIASEKFEVYATYNKNKVSIKDCTLIKMDVTDKKQLKIIGKINPDVIIHCSALVNVDQCEKHPQIAYRQNVLGTKNIVEISENIGSFLVHISTDSVYDGKRGNYSEEDKTNPVNVYGRTKLQAEEEVKKSNHGYCIVRTNIYGWNKRNKFSLAEWMINKLENGEELPAFRDVKFTPILVNNLAYALFEIYQRKIQDMLNVSGSEGCSKLEFAEKIADVFKLNKNLIRPISIDDLELTAKRGENLSLNTKKARSLLETKLLNVEEGLREMKRLREEGYVKELKGK